MEYRPQLSRLQRTWATRHGKLTAAFGMTVSPMNSGDKSVSLVLGSGGARGLAHIGVLHWLEEQDLKVVSISGCSIGALVGGVYAAGRLQEFEEWVRAIDRFDILRLLDFAWGANGLVQGDKVIDALVELVGDQQIEDLAISFTAVATNLHTEKEIWFRSGRLFDAIRASISLPLFFTPYRHHGMDLIDGGVLNPVPIAPTFSDDSDLTIAVNLGGAPERRDKRAPSEDGDDSLSTVKKKVREFLSGIGIADSEADEKTLNAREIVHQTFDAMQGTIARQKLAAYPPDHLVTIPHDACGILEFDRASEMIGLGYEKAEQCLGELRS